MGLQSRTEEHSEVLFIDSSLKAKEFGFYSEWEVKPWVGFEQMSDIWIMFEKIPCITRVEYCLYEQSRETN